LLPRFCDLSAAGTLFSNAEVLLAAEHVTVTKATLADWEELQDGSETDTGNVEQATTTRTRTRKMNNKNDKN